MHLDFNNKEVSKEYALDKFLFDSQNVQYVLLIHKEKRIPIPFRNLILIKKIIRAPFVQKTMLKFDEGESDEFLKLIGKKFHSIIFTSNLDCKADRKYIKSAMKNYILDLRQPFDKVKENYEPNVRRLVSKIVESNELEIGEISNEDFIRFGKKHSNVSIPSFYLNWVHVLTILKQRQVQDDIQIDTYGVYKEKTLVSVFLIFQFQNRIYNAYNVSSSEGKELNAATYFFHNYFSKNCGGNKIFDFQGSNIPGIERFIKSLGGKLETYYHYEKKWFSDIF